VGTYVRIVVSPKAGWIFMWYINPEDQYLKFHQHEKLRSQHENGIDVGFRRIVYDECS